MMTRKRRGAKDFRSGATLRSWVEASHLLWGES
jgi:hypothetical protein